MNYKNYIQTLGFHPKENTSNIYIKKYQDGYAIEIDFKKEIINYGNKIICENKTTSNFSQPENFVVLECVNRLLETGYKPENIILEKTWAAGHGTSGRLDICVTHDNGSEYLLIECKTYGKEFEKEFARLKKDGGQLFTYFKFSNKADLLMLYASELKGNKIIYQEEIIKIKDEYRVGDVKDFYKNWDKKTYQNLVWENQPYNSEIKKKYTKADLKPLTEDVSSKIFHEFASILRKHSVSDKPNAFNKIFNLFLAKLYDEAKGENDELEFHWREDDNPVDFQVRLVNLHRDGLFAFLEKEIAGIEDSDFSYNTNEELREKKKNVLKFNNVLAIKDVLDDADFDANQRVLKDVVKLLEKYQIRYPRKQQHLSDFFEKLLTTGLKQEVGQYFTPPPITKFIVRSLPLKEMILADANNQVAKLPAIIDYAAGSGHFITEAMEEYQDIINEIDIDKNIKYPIAKKEVASWQADPYNWAAKYVYGIEKDYRLTKVAKVGCYFYGDGVAQIIHGDGLDNFETSKTYKGLLKENTNLEDSTKAKFSIVLSNPPYSVNDCKDDLEYIGSQNVFTLYPYLTDKSKDIESLFVERTKQLLKDDGIAAVILPSSILNNIGIQTKTREIILQFFDIIAIAELGSNTFMATGTNTITLFLKRKNNQVPEKLKNYIDKFFTEYIDNAINLIDKPIAQYIQYVWGNITFDDYVNLLKNEPTKTVEEHELYKEYRKKLKAKTEKEFWEKLIALEKDKMLYYLLAYDQKNIVLVKSGEKETEKRFLGYYFSDRRGSEGIHAMQGGKTIDQCTQLYNVINQTDPSKASSYIYNAFLGNEKLEIAENLKNHIAYTDLLEILTFDRADFEKNISLTAKKKVKIESKWELSRISNIIEIEYGTRIVKGSEQGTKYPVYGGGGETFRADNYNRENAFIISRFGMSPHSIRYVENKFFLNDSGLTIKSKNEKSILQSYLNYFLFLNQNLVYECGRGVAQKNLDMDAFNAIQIPLPPLDIQQKIVYEIEVLEKKESKAIEEVEKLREDIKDIVLQYTNKSKKEKLGNISNLITKGSSPKWQGINYTENEEILFVTSENVREGFLDLSKIKYLENKFNEIQPRSILQKNDILINIVGASIGRACIFNLDKIANINQAVALVRCDENIVNIKLLNKFLNSENAISMYNEMKIDVARANLSLQNVSDLEIPLPPISEQQKIVSEIEKIEEKINTLEAELANIPQQKEAVLKKYLN